MWLGLPWYFWAALLLIVVIFRLTIMHGKASLPRLKPEVRDLTDKEREAIEKSPFKDEMYPEATASTDAEKEKRDNQSSQQS